MFILDIFIVQVYLGCSLRSMFFSYVVFIVFIEFGVFYCLVFGDGKFFDTQGVVDLFQLFFVIGDNQKFIVWE